MMTRLRLPSQIDTDVTADVLFIVRMPAQLEESK